MKMHIIEIICSLLEMIPLHITIGMICIPVGWVLGEIIKIAVDILIIIILIINIIKYHKKIKEEIERINSKIKKEE